MCDACDFDLQMRFNYSGIISGHFQAQLGGRRCTELFMQRVVVGTMMGITNTVATLPGFIGPTVVGALTYRNVSSGLHTPTIALLKLYTNVKCLQRRNRLEV